MIGLATPPMHGTMMLPGAPYLNCITGEANAALPAASVLISYTVVISRSGLPVAYPDWYFVGKPFG